MFRIYCPLAMFTSSGWSGATQLIEHDVGPKDMICSATRGKTRQPPRFGPAIAARPIWPSGFIRSGVNYNQLPDHLALGTQVNETVPNPFFSIIMDATMTNLCNPWLVHVG